MTPSEHEEEHAKLRQAAQEIYSIRKQLVQLRATGVYSTCTIQAMCEFLSKLEQPKPLDLNDLGKQIADLVNHQLSGLADIDPDTASAYRKILEQIGALPPGQ